VVLMAVEGMAGQRASLALADSSRPGAVKVRGERRKGERRSPLYEELSPM
jgi:hypothetical protein